MSFKPPGPLNINNDNVSNEWTLFKNQFQLFLTATESDSKSDVIKVAQLLNVIGPDALSIFYTFKLGEVSSLKLKDVIEAFDKHFSPKTNVVYQRFLFYKRSQARGEPFNTFLTDLRKLANSCEFGTEEENLIRDRIVMGIDDPVTQERLLREANIKLEEAVKFCRLVEASREHVSVISRDKIVSSGDFMPVGQVHRPTTVKMEEIVHSVGVQQKKSFPKHGKFKKFSLKKDTVKGEIAGKLLNNTTYLCKKCNTNHLPAQCPAFGKKCFVCNKLNHFSVGCFKNKNRPVPKQVNDVLVTGEREFKIDSVSNGDKHSTSDELAWFECLSLNGCDLNFKLDSGAEINILPKHVLLQIDPQLVDYVVKSNIKLESYGGFKLKTDGVITLSCRPKSNNMESMEDFVIVSHTKCIPIIGLNTCVKLGLIKRVNSVDVSKSSFVEHNSDVFTGLGCFKGKHHLNIDCSVEPVVKPPRRVPYSVMPKLKNTLQELEKIDVIRRVEKPRNWVSNLVIVEKSDKTLRLCLDPQALNSALKPEPFMIPTVDEIKTKLSGKRFFSVFDIKNGFWHVSLDEESSHLCTFSSPYGCYRFLRLPFGIKVAPEIFQKINSQIFSDIDGVTVYFDDLLIAAESQEQHDKIVKVVLCRARQNNVKFNPKKVQYRLNKVTFLGLCFGSEGVCIDENNVKSVIELPDPTSKKELQSMLGLFNYFRDFTPHMSGLNSPLRELLKKDSKWSWLPVHSECVKKLKHAVTSAPVLATFDRKKPIEVHSDASKDGLGCCVLQEGRPISFASRSLNYAEQQYAQVEKEMLSIVFAVTKFHHLLYGNSFVVLNDSKPLESVMLKPIHKILSPRLQRLKLKLVKYDLTIKYTPGKSMVVADLLSRSFKNVCSSNYDSCKTNICTVEHVVPYDLPISEVRKKEFRECTENDPALKLVKSFYKNGWPKKKNALPECVNVYFSKRNELYVHDELVFLNDKIVVPITLRKPMLNLLHEVHLGCEKTKSRARQLLYWPGMSVDIDNVVSKCSLCQKYMNANTKEVLRSHEVPDLPFSKIGIDIAEYGDKIYLIVIDYYTKWPECIKLKSKTSTEVICELKKVFSVHGIPTMVIGDNNPFGSFLFKQFASEWNFEVNNSSPMYPKSNGQVERTVQTIKKLIKKCSEDKVDLEIALLEFRNTPVIGNLSPAQLLMSRRLRSKVPLSASLLTPKVYDKSHVNKIINDKQKVSASYHDKNARPRRSFKLHDIVNVYNVRTHVWEPGKVVGFATTPSSYIVRLDHTGSVLQRTSFHLRERPTNSVYKNVITGFPSPSFSTAFNSSPRPAYEPNNGSPVQTSPRPNTPVRLEQMNSTPQPRTKFGRPIRKPIRFKDFVEND